MILNNLTDDQLWTRISDLAREERRVTTEVLWHLREVERRRLFATRGYGSLYEYALRELRYSEGAAHRRISAMRLLTELPEAEIALRDGSLNVTTLSQVQTFLRAEKREAGRQYTLESKRALLKEMTGKSKRECERTLAAISPESARPERERVVSETETEIRFTANARLMKKLERLRALAAHSVPSGKYADLIEWMADRALAKLEKDRPGGDAIAEAHAKGKDAQKPQQVQRTASPPVEVKSENPRHIPAALRRQTWAEAGGTCTHLDPKTGRRCGSTYALEIDHIVPVALGGRSEAANLRLYCRVHNAAAAIKILGQGTMARYLRV